MKTVLSILACILVFQWRLGFSQERGLGLGIVVGEPTGINGKFWLSSTTALDFAAAWAFDHQFRGNTIAYNDAVQLHADYLMHNFNLIPVQKGKFPLFYGLGARMIFGHETGVGLRIPVGLDYMFANDRVDIFFEIVPVLDLAPSTRFDLNGAIGARFWIH